MSKLMQAIDNSTTTENGMTSFKSTLNPVLDLFFSAGASRGKNITDKFKLSMQADKDLTIRLALWLRDIRGGAGEREQFKNFLRFAISKMSYSDILRIINKVPEIGRWDDLMVFWGTPYQSVAANLWTDAIVAHKKAKDILQNLNNMSESECEELFTSMFGKTSDI